MIVSILQNVICKILRRRPCQNFLLGVLCVTQGHRITYRYVPQGRLWVESSSIDSGPVWPCGGTGLFAPKTIRSRERKFQVWNFRSLELSHPGTFAPTSE